MVINIFTEHKWMNIQVKQKIENIRKYQIELTELNNTITELKKKKTLEHFNSRLNEVEERTGEIKDRAVELTQSEQKKRKKNGKN